MTPTITYPPHRRGTRFFETINLTQTNGSPLPITGWAFSCPARAFTGSATVLCDLVVTITDGPNGQITVELDSADTLAAALDNVPTLEASLLSIDTDGDETEEAVLIIPLKDQI